MKASTLYNSRFVGELLHLIESAKTALKPLLPGCYLTMAVLANASFSTTMAQCGFTISPESASLGCLATTADVVWSGSANVNISESGLSKTNGGTNWNAGAISVAAVENYGYAQTTVAETNRERAFGLSQADGSYNINSIQFAFRLRNDGQLEVIESGSNRGNKGSYQSGDTLRISIENEIVSYLHNGEVVYVSNISPTLPMYVDVSIRQVGGTIQDAEIGNFSDGSFYAHGAEDFSALDPSYQWTVNGIEVGANQATFTPAGITNGDALACTLTTTSGCAVAGVLSNDLVIDLAEAFAPGNFYITGSEATGACHSVTEEVQWNQSSLSNLQAQGNDLIKIQGGTNWNANASSLGRLFDNGRLSFSTAENNRQKSAGLSHEDVDANFNTIQYCIDLRDNGTIRIFETGVNRGSFGNYTSSDLFSIAVENNTVHYYKNDEILYISNVSPSLPLMADVSIRQVNATISGVTIANLNDGIFNAFAENAGPNPSYEWLINGLSTGSSGPNYTNTSLNNGDVISCALSPDLGGCDAVYYSSNTIIKNELPDAGALNFYISANNAASACNTATEEVYWDINSQTNVQAIGNNLEKIQGGTSWNAGASSLNLVANNGTLHFSTNESNRQKAIGLSQNDINLNFNSIEYSFMLENNGTLRIYESGINRGNFGSYSAGDQFSIDVDNGVVKYFKNGNLLRISNVDPILPLKVDVSLRQVNAGITDVRVTNLNEGAFTANAVNAGDNPFFQWKLNGTNVGNNEASYQNLNLVDGDVVSCTLSPDLGGCNDITYVSNSVVQHVVPDPASINFFITGVLAPSACYSATEEVQWNTASIVNVEVLGNSMQKLQGGNNWNAGAFSSNALADNGSFGFSTAESNRQKAAGLSSANSGENYTGIDYCFFMESNGNLRIFESGVNRGNFGTYSAGDSLNIALEAGVVKYFRNGNLLRISTVPPSLPLFADISIRSVDGSITNAQITNLNGGQFQANTENAGENPFFQWKLNGVDVGTNNSTYINNNLSQGDVLTCMLSPDLGGCAAVSYTSNAIRQNEIESPASINFYITGETSLSACHEATEEVQWNGSSLLHVETSGTNLTKVQSGNSWNGNAASFNKVDNNGALSFKTSETNRAKAIGLSNTDSGNDRNSIQYCFFLEGNGNLRISESGTDRGGFGTYNVNDSLSIAVESNVVKYYRNGALLRISPAAPVLPLLADVSLYSIGATLRDVRITNLSGGAFTANVESGGPSPSFQWLLNGNPIGENSSTYFNNNLNDGDIVRCELSPDLGGCDNLNYLSNAITHKAILAPAAINFFITGSIAEASCHTSTEEVHWKVDALNNVQSSGTDLLKVQSSNWNGNASSLNKVGNGGAFSFSTAENNRTKAIGLSQNDVSNDYNSIQYCFYLEGNSNMRIYESGFYRGNFGSYMPGDSLSISIESGVVKYYKNSNLLYISNVAPNLPLLADASLFSVNSTITDAKVRNLNAGSFTANVEEAGATPIFQWKLNGLDTGDGSNTYNNPNLVSGDEVTCLLSPSLAGCGNVGYTSNAIVKDEIEGPAEVNFFITGISAGDACYSAIEAVQWDLNSLQNTSSSGNEIIKVQGGNNWNGNASSLNKVKNNGSFSFSTAENNRAKSAGLSSTDANSSLFSIRYCFFMESNSNLRIYEAGANRGNFGTYSPGDSLSIAVNNGQVRYFKNGNLLYVSNLAPSLPLIVDVSLNSISSTLIDAYISNPNGGAFTANAEMAGSNPSYQWMLNGNDVGNGSANYTNTNLNHADVISCSFSPDIAGCTSVNYLSNTIEIKDQPLSTAVTFYAQGTVDQGGFGYALEQVVWIPSSLQNLIASQNNLEKVQGSSNWDGGAASFNTVKDNGYVEFTVSETNRRRMLGLSSTNANANFNTIRYAFYLDNGALRVYENGTNRGSFGGINSGDVLRIAVENGEIRYYRNETFLYASNLSPSLPLLVDVSINAVGGTVTDAIVANRTGGAFTATASGAGDNPAFQWKRNGANVGINAATYTNTGLFDGDVITCTITPDLDGCSTASYLSNEILITGPGATTDWTGAINTLWNLSANWTDGLPNNFRSARIPAGVPNWPSINALSQVFDIEIEENAVLNFSGNNTLQVYGNLNNNGTFNAGAGTLVLTGDTTKTISGNLVSTNRLIINLGSPTDSIILNTPLSVTFEALLLSGIIYTGGHEMVYHNGAESRFASANSYVDGLCRKTGTDAFTFPVGKEGIYAPVSISAPSQSGSQFTASYHRGDPQDAGYDVTLKDEGVTNIGRCEYWMVNRELGESPVYVSLSYENERSCGINNPEELKVVRWNGSQWQDHGYLIHEGSNEEGIVTSAGAVVNFSPFTLGSGSSINPLPVDLITFAVKAENAEVKLNWITATEVNNDFFTIERSKDGQTFEVVKTVPGAGNVSHQLSYHDIDRKPYSGTSYYRLKQTDFDGTSKTYPMQAVHIKTNVNLHLFPNPSAGMLEIQLQDMDGTSQLRIINMAGKIVHTATIGAAIAKMDLGHLKAGVYVIQITHGSMHWQQKWVLQK